MSHSSGLLFFLILTFLGSFLVFDTKDSYSLWRLLSDILALMTFCFLSYLRPVVNFVFHPHSLSEILSPSMFSLCFLLTTAFPTTSTVAGFIITFCDSSNREGDFHNYLESL